MDSSRRHHRYYDLLLAAFVVVLLCSNFIGAGKAAVINLPYFGAVPFGAGILFSPFPIFLATFSLRSMAMPMTAEQCGQALLL